MQPIKLHHNQVVRGFCFDYANKITIRTVRGLAKEAGASDEAAEESYANCREFKHATAWTYQQPSILTDHYAGKAEELEKERQEIRDSVILDNNQLVSIEGETFKVRLAGERFSDPIHFIRVIA